jgi:putative nucleic acid modification protein with dual OB domain
MPTFDLICLANSRKRRGRCIAGLRVDGQGWVRPVSATADGELYPQNYRLANGGYAQVLDLLRIEVGDHHPKQHHPEDWLLSWRPWELLARPIPLSDYQDLLQRCIVRGPGLLGNEHDRMDFAGFANHPAQASLALVQLHNITWHITLSRRGNRQVRALFSLGGVDYNLGVTDPAWEARLQHLAVSESEAGHDVMLTVSLSEPFNGYCFKLVATVTPL